MTKRTTRYRIERRAKNPSEWAKAHGRDGWISNCGAGYTDEARCDCEIEKLKKLWTTFEYRKRIVEPEA